MTEPDSAMSVGAPAPTAGSLLREARQAQGLHVAALAALIKVPQRKIESLEADRLDELPGATFTRALANTMCRALKIDPAPVLALLPHPAAPSLEHVSEGINAPFRDRPGRREPRDLAMLATPAVWGPALVVLATAVVYLMPEGWLSRAPTPEVASPGPAASDTISIVVPPQAVSESIPEPAAPASAASAVPASPPASPAASAPALSSAVNGPLLLRTKAESWVEVEDARSRLLLSRIMQPGESVVLGGATPLRVTVGNVADTEVVFRGKTMDLAPLARDNVARLELK